MSEQQTELASPPLDVLSTPAEVAAHVEATGVAAETPVVVEASAKEEPASRLVPIELRGVDLFVELRVPAAAAEQFEKTQSIIARLREKFGQDALLEELAQVVSGTIERVCIRPGPNAPAQTITQPQMQQQVQAQPVAVQIPQTQQDYGAYLVQSNSTPWKGQALRNLDPMSIYKVLYTPEGTQLKNLLTPQDLTMMDAYYRGWHEAQQKMPPLIGQAVSLSNDDIPW